MAARVVILNITFYFVTILKPNIDIVIVT